LTEYAGEQCVADADDVRLGDKRAGDGIADGFARGQRPLRAARPMSEMQRSAAAHDGCSAIGPNESPIETAVLGS
jgi:hypothetical protein